MKQKIFVCFDQYCNGVAWVDDMVKIFDTEEKALDWVLGEALPDDHFRFYQIHFVE
jgi:hypothetical protein